MQRAGLAPGTYKLEVTPVVGFPVPPRTNVVVEGGSIRTITFTYGSGELEDWRRTHFGTVQNAGLGADDADPDRDGSPNINEFVAGTDPNDISDVIKILSITRQNVACTLEMSGKEGRVYELQLYNFPGLGDSNSMGSWTTKASIGPLSSNTRLTLTDPVNHADSALYRVRVNRP
jgi:hypothetical protein